MNPEGISAGFYFVGYVDLLGQQSKLSQFKTTAPRTAEELAAFDRVMSDTGAVVRNVRDSVARWLNAATDVNEERLANVPAERREEFKSILTPASLQSGFSDCFAVAFPLQVSGVEEGLSRARATYELWRTLLGLGVLSLESLAQGIPWRAGLDVGIGMLIYPNEVYGPALVSAYKLESTVAEFPRLAIGRGLLDYLSHTESLPASNPLNTFAAKMATDCREMICGADDGWPMLHVLAPVILKALPHLPERARAAGDWVQQQSAAHFNAKEEKLYRRYSRLSGYFRAFLPKN